MTPQEIADFKQKLVSQMVSKRWQSLSDVDLDLGYNLLSVDQKQIIAKSLTTGDHAAMELIRNFLIDKMTAQAELQADDFISNNPSAASFVADIL